MTSEERRELAETSFKNFIRSLNPHQKFFIDMWFQELRKEFFDDAEQWLKEFNDERDHIDMGTD